MQLAVAISETGDPATIGKPMEKRREIPAAGKPNAAPRAEVDRVKSRIEALQLDFHDAVESAGISRPTGYRLLKGEASVGTLRDLEEWVVKEEHRLKRPPQPTSEQQDEMQSEWAELGRVLAKLDPAQFAQSLEGVRDLVESVKLRERGIRKIFRATPDQDT